ncbi:MAG: hypothetical protein WC379_06260 [Methanoregula sp.]|jgi:hypothetical protein
MKVVCKNFPDDYPLLKRDRELNVSLPALVWAAVTVGAPSLSDVNLSSWPAIAFAFHKAFAIESIMNIDNNEISLQPNYENLDQSEKVVLSYWTGMMLTKLVSDQFLGVPYPAHVRAMQKKLQLTTNPETSLSLPDLIGQDPSKKWHVLEAKCYKKDPGPKEKESWTLQAQRVIEIDGIPPSTTSYCFTTLQPSKYGSNFKMEWVDPEIKKDSDSFSIDVYPIQLLQFYYRPFFEIFKNVERKDLRDDDGIIFLPKRICDNHENKWSIGILEDILDQLRELMDQDFLKNKRTEIEISNIVEKYKKKTKYDSSINTHEYLGSDGIAVKKG